MNEQSDHSESVLVLDCLDIDHEIIASVISLPLIQDGQLSVTGESICTKILTG